MTAQAARLGAPRMTRAAAAQALGADLAQLERVLDGRASDADAETRTSTGLREDQAAAALSVLTDGRRVSVINAPAGSGKTRVLAEAARHGRRRGSGRLSASPRPSPPATPWPPASRSPVTAPSSSATSPAGAAPAASPSPCRRGPCW
jgi:hypothetical protein